MYKEIYDHFTGQINPRVVLNVETGATIPKDENNKDWRDVKQWLKTNKLVKASKEQ